MVDRPESEWRSRMERKLDELCRSIKEMKRDVIGNDVESAGRCLAARISRLESHRERVDRGTGRWARVLDTVLAQLIIAGVTALIATVIFTRAMPQDAAARLHSLPQAKEQLP